LYIEKLHNSKYKIHLTPIDMSMLDISYSKLRLNDNHTKTTVLKLLDLVKEQYPSINISKGKITAEVFPTLDGSYIFHLNILVDNNISFFLASTQSSNIIFCVCNGFKNVAKKFNIKSSLYILNNNYFLLLSCKNKYKSLILHIASEFYIDVCEYDAFPLFLYEHGKYVISINAIEKL